LHGTRALKSSTAETPEMVREFLEILTEQLQKRAAADFNTMKEMKTAEYPGFVGQVRIILLHFEYVLSQDIYCCYIKSTLCKSTAVKMYIRI
jgi:hypothetical protein